mmetsp:Transcript_56574/g.104715  ORF Transcript_56574/g.104715 Transcript_56574/m.104715 type:complete len:240 (+) Transcript_56574:80-799(+)
MVEWVAATSKNNRELVLAAVTRNANALQWVSETYTGDYEIVLAAVTQNGCALEWASESCASDREIVLAAVKQHGCALEFASKSCQNDREIVLAAVAQNALALPWSSDTLRGDPEIILAAVMQCPHIAFQYAPHSLLEDPSFAPEAKRRFYLLKISMLSGRSCCMIALCRDSTWILIRECCRKLKLPHTGTEQLLCGSAVLPATSRVGKWPGIQPKGQVTECQLIIQQSEYWSDSEEAAV